MDDELFEAVMNAPDAVVADGLRQMGLDGNGQRVTANGQTLGPDYFTPSRNSPAAVLERNRQASQRQQRRREAELTLDDLRAAQQQAAYAMQNAQAIQAGTMVGMNAQGQLEPARLASQVIGIADGNGGVQVRGGFLAPQAYDARITEAISQWAGNNFQAIFNSHTPVFMPEDSFNRAEPQQTAAASPEVPEEPSIDRWKPVARKIVLE